MQKRHKINESKEEAKKKNLIKATAKKSLYFLESKGQ